MGRTEKSKPRPFKIERVGHPPQHLRRGHMKQTMLVLALLPLLAFLVAGVAELRSNRKLAGKLSSLVPVVLGIAAFGFSFNPEIFLALTPSSSVTLSRVMTLFSALIACSGSFVPYSRRSSSVLIAAGGLLTAFFWMFFGPTRA